MGTYLSMFFLPPSLIVPAWFGTHKSIVTANTNYIYIYIYMCNQEHDLCHWYSRHASQLCCPPTCVHFCSYIKSNCYVYFYNRWVLRWNTCQASMDPIHTSHSWPCFHNCARSAYVTCHPRMSVSDHVIYDRCLESYDDADDDNAADDCKFAREMSSTDGRLVFLLLLAVITLCTAQQKAGWESI